MGVGLLVSGLLLAACGGTPASSSSTSSTTVASASHSTTKTPARVSAAFTNCLKAHGFSLPSGGFSRSSQNQKTGGTTSATRPTNATQPNGNGGFTGGGPQSAKAQAAFKACAKYRPKGFGTGGGFAGGFAGGSSNSAATAAFRNCMSLHGVKLSEPGKTTTRPSTTSGSSTQRPLNPRNNPKYAAAFNACKTLLPTTSTTTTTAG